MILAKPFAKKKKSISSWVRNFFCKHTEKLKDAKYEEIDVGIKTSFIKGYLGILVSYIQNDAAIFSWINLYGSFKTRHSELVK